jgi:hypothetical protein
MARADFLGVWGENLKKALLNGAAIETTKNLTAGYPLFCYPNFYYNLKPQTIIIND